LIWVGVGGGDCRRIFESAKVDNKYMIKGITHWWVAELEG